MNRAIQKIQSGMTLLTISLLLHFQLSAGMLHVDVMHEGPLFDGSAGNPYNNLQTAISAAQSGDTIKVAQGVYNQNIYFPGSRGLVLRGGYQSGNFDNRNINTFETVLQGDGSQAVVRIEYSGGFGDYQLYEIDGFTIQNGQRGIDAISYGNGGFASLIISHNIIQNNTGLTGSNDFGGGISSRAMIAVIRNNIIRNNTCGKSAGFAVQLNSTEHTFVIENNLVEHNDIFSDHGAGAGIQAYRGVIRNNIFRNNRILNPWGWGGGLIVDGNVFSGFSNEIFIELSGNTYEGNEAPSGGAGLFIDEGANVRMFNELIIHNTSTSSRNGGLLVDGPRANSAAKTIIENTTIAHNQGADWNYGHAITIEGGSEVVARNSIFWENQSSDNQVDFYVDHSSSLLVEYCIYQTGKQGDGAYSVTNSFTDHPLFADPLNGNFRLKSIGGRWEPSSGQWVIDPEHSPAIDAGDPTSSFSNEPLPNGDRLNLGAYGNTIYASKSFDANQGNIFFVGPGRTYTTLQQVAGLLNPGDIVFVDGNHTYPGGIVFNRPGTAEQKIQIRGVRINGNRPVIEGGYNGVAFTTPWPFTGPEGGHHYIFEGFEVAAAEFRGIFHQAKDLTIRDCYVRDCLAHGILGADQGAGSLLLEYTEVARCGQGFLRHQIYMATDQVNNPGSVFRMQHCYVHSGNGGNNVKTRAERNEIYYNWIEGAWYHELEMIGADPEADGGNPFLAREDSDVVGNVFFKKTTAANNPDFYTIRIGGDGTGASHGRYRFLNNTFISGSSAVFRMYDQLESVEIHNNVFHNPAGIVSLARTIEAIWTSGQEEITGHNNWMKTGTLLVPAQLSGTIYGADPGFTDLPDDNLRPLPGSPLVDAGILPVASAPGFEFPNPLPEPLKLPPSGTAESLNTAHDRNTSGIIDIGAFESEDGIPYYIVSPASINFGTVFTGFTQTAQITITSLGNIPAIIDSIKINSLAYQLSVMNFPMIIEGLYTFDVVFAPSQTQSYPAIVTIYSSQIVHRQVNLSGIGIEEPEGGFRISGEVSGFWQIYDTIFADGDIIVPPGQTLSITPVSGGTDILFTGPYKFIVYGKLELLGNESDSIRIYSANTSEGWRGLKFINLNTNGMGNSNLQYCSFRYGNSTGNDWDSYGGAVFVYASSNLVIQNCSFSQNHSNAGGGIYINFSSPTLSNCLFSDNSAIESGGAMFIGYNSDPQIININLHGNTAQGGNGGGVVIFQGSAPAFQQGIIANNTAESGGGIACYSSLASFNGLLVTGNQATGAWASGGGVLSSSSPIISNCIITNNTSAGSGGGVACTYQHSPVIQFSEISNNQAVYGGGLSCFYESNPVISNTDFMNNSATYGGAMYIWGGSNPAITDAGMTANTASANGGAIYIENADGHYQNVSLSQNQADGQGGAVFIHQQSSPVFYNPLIFSNHADEGGGVFLLNTGAGVVMHNLTLAANTSLTAGAGIVAAGSSPAFYSSVFWNNLANEQIANIHLEDNNSDPWFGNSLVQGGIAAFTGPGGGANYQYSSFVNNLDADPLFADELSHNFRLTASSPALNSGWPNAGLLELPGTDFDGNPRIFSHFIDMGCFEFQEFPHTFYLGSLQIPGNDEVCFAATNMLILAGSENSLVMQPGSSSRFEAGISILLKDGLWIQSTAHAVFRIEAEGNYCVQENKLLSAELPDFFEEEKHFDLPEEKKNISSVRLYPNPNFGNLFIAFDERLSGEISVQVAGIRGETFILSKFIPKEVIQLDIGHLKPGIYFVRLFTADKTSTHKIIKH